MHSDTRHVARPLARAIHAHLGRPVAAPRPAFDHASAIERAYAAFRAAVKDQDSIRAEFQTMRAAADRLYGESMPVPDVELYERARARVLLRARAYLERDLVAAAREDGESRCVYCDGDATGGDVQAIAGRLIHDRCVSAFGRDMDDIRPTTPAPPRPGVVDEMLWAIDGADGDAR